MWSVFCDKFSDSRDPIYFQLGIVYQILILSLDAMLLPLVYTLLIS